MVDASPQKIPKLKINFSNIQYVPQPQNPAIVTLAVNQNIKNHEDHTQKPKNNNILSPQSQKTARQFYHWLLRQHERKDPHKIFFEEVTDQIAPGYSRLVKIPMCFEKIRAKIDKNLYSNTQNLKSDFKLIFENCILYNTSDTIYHTFGQKMLVFTEKIFDKKKLESFVREIPFLRLNIEKREMEQILGFQIESFDFDKIRISRPDLLEKELKRRDLNPLSHNYEEESDFDDRISTDSEIDKVNDSMAIPVDDEGNPLPNTNQPKKRGRKPKNFGLVNNDGSIESPAANSEACNTKKDEDKPKPEEDVAEQVKTAALLAREKLAKLRPNNTMGFLKRKGDGSISYNILIDSAIEQAKKRKRSGTNQKEMKLVDTIGRLKPGQGRPTLPLPYNGPSCIKSVLTKRRAVLKPIEYLDYGPFGSFSPCINQQMYDRYTDEEMTYIRSAYDTPAGALYAESASFFVENSSEWTVDHVDRILDGFTNKKHLTYKNYVDYRKKIGENLDKEKNIIQGKEKCPEKLSKEKLDGLLSLKEEFGIDLDFLSKKYDKTNKKGCKPETSSKNDQHHDKADDSDSNGNDKSRTKNNKNNSPSSKNSKKSSNFNQNTSKNNDQTESSNSKKSKTTEKNNCDLLETNGEKIQKLKKLQDQRFSKNPKYYGDKTFLKPDLNEYHIIADCEKNFAKMIKENNPGDVVSRNEIRQHFGVIV